ncbi:MAG: ATP-grasp domain-containing protein, partial [Acidimicrobiia bacterium]
MDLFEYQGKQLFGRWSIPISEGRIAETAEEAKQIASELGGKVVVKAQVQIGGRGKAGGIKLADDPGSAFDAAKQIIGMDIRGHTVERVLVERASEIKAEYYAALTLDRAARKHLFMVSSKGGVDIEEVAATEPQTIARVHIDPLLGLQSYQVTQLVYGSGIAPEARAGVAALLPKLYQLYIEADASLVEVNP